MPNLGTNGCLSRLGRSSPAKPKSVRGNVGNGKVRNKYLGSRPGPRYSLVFDQLDERNARSRAQNCQNVGTVPSTDIRVRPPLRPRNKGSTEDARNEVTFFSSLFNFPIISFIPHIQCQVQASIYWVASFLQNGGVAMLYIIKHDFSVSLQPVDMYCPVLTSTRLGTRLY